MAYWIFIILITFFYSKPLSLSTIQNSNYLPPKSLYNLGTRINTNT